MEKVAGYKYLHMDHPEVWMENVAKKINRAIFKQMFVYWEIYTILDLYV